ncbi:MAG: endo-alpha-N-acetylgalactosaminidase family protein [Anaerorhabdus sp.]
MKRKSRRSTVISIFLTVMLLWGGLIVPQATEFSEGNDAVDQTQEELDVQTSETPEISEKPAVSVTPEVSETPAVVIAEEPVASEQTTSRFDELLAEMYNNIPEGQQKVSYSNNYESMEPENYTVQNGVITSAILTGKNVLSALPYGKGSLDKSPYFTSGYYRVTFSHDVVPVGAYSYVGVGFLIKAGDKDVTFRMDVEKAGGVDGEPSWILENSTGQRLNIKGPDIPKLEANTDYTLEMLFYNDRFVVALNGNVFYDGETDVLTSVAQNARQFGVWTRYLKSNIAIDDLYMEGVGYTEKPKDPPVVYFKDYEDSNPGNWTAPAIASVVDDGSGTNNILILKAIGDGHYVDLASPEIASGGFSVDFRLINPGSGFAFDFRTVYTGSTISALNAFSYAPHEKDWIWETKSKWSGTLNVGEPEVNTWNNLIINFDGDMLVVYLNKEKMGEYTYDQFKDAVAGRFGVRLRRYAEIYIDNLTYSSEPIIPEVIKAYKNNFDEGVTGVWSEEVKIASEGTNKVLELNSDGRLALLDAGITLNSGTALFRVKPTSKEVSFAIASSTDHKAVISYKNDRWYLIVDENELAFSETIAGLLPYKWNTVGAQFKPGEVVLDINGQQGTVVLPNGVSLSKGTFGFASVGQAYLDDLIYTEKLLPFLTPGVETEKMYYLNYFDTETQIDWTNFTNVVTANGKLSATLAGKTEAMDNTISVVENGMYQIQVSSNKAVGAQLGNIRIYPNGETWMAAVDGKDEVTIGSYTGKIENEVIIKVQKLKGEGTLWINNIYVGIFDASKAEDGLFGVYNPNAEAIQVSVDAIGAEEIRIFSRTWDEETVMDWAKIEGTGNVLTSVTDGVLAAAITPVVTAVDKTTPSFLDQKIEFDFSVNVTDDIASGGRYGFVLRGNESSYVSIVCDIGGRWSVGIAGNYYNFGPVYSLNKDEVYRMDASIINGSISFGITDSEGNRTNMGSVNASKMENLAGHFGVRGWYGSKTISIDNLIMEEVATLPMFQLSPNVVELRRGNFKVNIDGGIPRVISYTVNGKQLETASEMNSSLIINGKAYTPQVSGELSADKTEYSYHMSFAEIKVEMDAKFTLSENNILSFEIVDIKEDGDFLVNTISLGSGALGQNRSNGTGATFAWAKSNGQWHGLSEEVVEDMTTIERSTESGVTMAMLSGDGLAISVENNVMSGGNKIVVKQEKKQFINTVTISNGEWTYRYSGNPREKTEELPMFKVVVTEDVNADDVVDWQDGAVAYRRYILIRPFEAEDMANNMMYIPFNFASQATDPFLNTLDQAKVIYNYTDGFGQMLLHKGYQDEGHDSAIPSYSSVGVRQGGVEDMKYLIQEGSEYNVSVGVHLNATEYHLDANELYYANLTGATNTGPYNIPTGSVNQSGYDRLSPGWDWVDTTFYVDQTKDVLSGELQKRFEDLANLVRTDDGETLDFYYIDVYTGNDYNAYKLVQYANSLGIKIGTEFAGPLEPGANFVHWGPDLGYPNKGNGSIVYRMVKNDQDIFVGNALFKGQKIAVVSTWGDSKPDIEQGVFVFFNEVLPTKYMQHFGVLKVDEDKIEFEQDVTSTRNFDTGKIELRRDGQIISTWEDTGTTTAENVRHTSEANSLIPWEWDNDNNVLTLNNGAKLYHWNTTGSETTWTLTNKFKAASAYDLYELTQQGKVKVATIPVVNGTLTISQARKNTPYVLYPTQADAEKIMPAAQNWGEGSEVLDFAFNSETIGGDGVWKAEQDNATIGIVEGRNAYSTSKETSVSRWNRYLAISEEGDTVYQDIKVVAGAGYDLDVWVKTPKGRVASLEVVIDGKTISTSVTGVDGTHQSNFKYRGDRWQRINVSFTVPAGVTEVQVRLVAEAGTGEVLFDDVKIWEHIVKEDEAKKEGYALYEDFENVSQGFGAFEYISGSLQSQLKQRSTNAIVTPDAKLQGPLFTWVLDGETSLKLAEGTVGRGIKSSESGLQLEPNTEYILGFNYTMESAVVYEVTIASRSTVTDVVLREILEVYPSSGDGKTSNSKEFTFTTKDQTDYQLAFKIKTVSSTGKTETKALILDEVYIRSADLDITRFAITTKPSTNGSFEVDKTEAREKELVTVRANPDEGFILDEIKVNGIVVESPFEMLGEDVEVEVSFREKANKTELEEAINKAKEIDLEKYTEDSAEDLKDTLKEAQEILGNDKATQEEVDKIVEKLTDAIEKLVEKPLVKPDKPVDKGLLEKAINEKGKESADKYTAESYAAYLEGLTFARQVYANKYASSADVTNAILWLNTAWDELVEKPVRETNVSVDEEVDAIDEIEVTPTPTPEVTETSEPQEIPDSSHEVTPTPSQEAVVEEENNDFNWFLIGGGVLLVLAAIGVVVVAKKMSE